MTTLAQRIEEAILAHARDVLDERAITTDPTSRHAYIETTYINNDEIDITALAELIAKALEPKDA